MARNNGSEQRSQRSGLPLIALAAAALGSGILLASFQPEGAGGMLRMFGLLPLQLAALIWVLPRMR